MNRIWEKDGYVSFRVTSAIDWCSNLHLMRFTSHSRYLNSVVFMQIRRLFERPKLKWVFSRFFPLFFSEMAIFCSHFLCAIWLEWKTWFFSMFGSGSFSRCHCSSFFYAVVIFDDDFFFCVWCAVDDLVAVTASVALLLPATFACYYYYYLVRCFQCHCLDFCALSLLSIAENERKQFPG